MINNPRIAIVSPFLDKSHGTERCVCEQIEYLAQTYGYEIHIYSLAVEDIANLHSYQHYPGNQKSVTRPEDDGSGSIWWHRMPDIPGPGLFQYLWWFVINHVWRWWDQYIHNIKYELVFSPGINCLDGDVIAIHIVFAEFMQRVKDELRLSNNPIPAWPWLIHRYLLYQVIILLEKCVYPRKSLVLTAISHKVVDDLSRFYDPKQSVPVIYYGFDVQRFNPDRCKRLRPSARHELGLPNDAFVILLIGNDWKKKGLPSLIKAMGQIQQSNLRLLVVGRDQTTPYQALIEHYHLQDQVSFLPPRRDVEWYYAATDVYVGPSLEDAFALPPAEAMACGVPAIVSSQAGVSEIVTHGVDAFVLREPTDASELAGYIKQLCGDSSLHERMGKQASLTTLKYTWKRNAAMLHMLFQETMLRKHKKGKAHG